MDKFDAQTLFRSGTDGSKVLMVFEDAKGTRFTLTLPSSVAPALVSVLEGLKGKRDAVGQYATRAQEWRTARDMDLPNVFLEVKGHQLFVFDVKGARALSEQLRQQCDDIEGRDTKKMQ